MPLTWVIFQSVGPSVPASPTRGVVSDVPNRGYGSGTGGRDDQRNDAHAPWYRSLTRAGTATTALFTHQSESSRNLRVGARIALAILPGGMVHACG